MGLFETFSARVAAFVDVLPTSISVEFDATLPHDARLAVLDPALPEAIRAAIADDLRPLLRQLDAATPLVRAPKDAVWETLRLTVHGHSGHSWLSVYNVMGQREHVATWGTEADPFARVVADWCASRRDSADLATAWDVARRGSRRVHTSNLEGPSLIDPGVYRAIDLITAAGGRTDSSCEGHPWNGYLSFDGAPMPVAADVFKTLGWALERWGGAVIAHMPTALTVAERDRRWREACAALEARLAPAEAPPALRR